MALQSFLAKSTLLVFLASVSWSLLAASVPVTGDATDDSVSTMDMLSKFIFPGGKCSYWSPKCTKPLIRKDWYHLSTEEQKSYLDAVLCLHKERSHPALHVKYPATENGYDDFVAIHSNQTPHIHVVGSFIVWHRYYLWVYEKTLREKCGYKGALPYWYIPDDLARGGDPNHWGIFSSTNGFGPNGVYVSHDNISTPYDIHGSTGGGCVPSGPFGASSTFRVNIRPGGDISTSNPTCVKRDFTPYNWAYCRQSNVDALLNQPDYNRFMRDVSDIPGTNFRGIHSDGHFGIGGIFGQMSDFFNSPGDPIFFLHHAHLDRVYWLWQLRNLPKRLCEISGPTVFRDYNLTQGPEVTLEDKLDIDVLGPPTRIGDLLSIVGGPFCYLYDHL